MKKTPKRGLTMKKRVIFCAFLAQLLLISALFSSCSGKKAENYMTDPDVLFAETEAAVGERIELMTTYRQAVKKKGETMLTLLLPDRGVIFTVTETVTHKVTGDTGIFGDFVTERHCDYEESIVDFYSIEKDRAAAKYGITEENDGGMLSAPDLASAAAYFTALDAVYAFRENDTTYFDHIARPSVKLPDRILYPTDLFSFSDDTRLTPGLAEGLLTLQE